VRYQIRNADERDLDRLAEFEIEIARISFMDGAIDDPDVHHKKLAKALTRDADGMFVAVDEQDAAVGWLWMAINQNFMTGEKYVNFRSLAVATVPERASVGELLLSTGLDYARRSGATSVVGKVHWANEAMRLLYRKFGFEATHLTLRRVLTE
jgi:ribosomal protein S18 acetylase RimI-like enzyme